MPKVKAPKSGRPTQVQLEERKARVIDAARQLFLSRGFVGTPVSEIARRSGVTPRLIAAHFGDKADIFIEIFRQANELAFVGVFQPDEGDTLEEVLLRAARFAWTMAYSPQAMRFLRMVVGEGERMASMTSVIAEKSAIHFFGEMELIFDDLMIRGAIAKKDSKRLAKYFVDLIIGFSVVQAGMGYWDRVSDETELRDKVAFFCHAIRAEGET
jgi:TetR/AcrR family transcriptional repressor of mexJK operon